MKNVLDTVAKIKIPTRGASQYFERFVTNDTIGLGNAVDRVWGEPGYGPGTHYAAHQRPLASPERLFSFSDSASAAAGDQSTAGHQLLKRKSIDRVEPEPPTHTSKKSIKCEFDLRAQIFLGTKLLLADSQSPDRVFSLRRIDAACLTIPHNPTARSSSGSIVVIDVSPVSPQRNIR